MNTSEIEKLLNRYYEGETTLEEEKILREFFSGPEIPPHLADHLPVFAWASESMHHEPEQEILIDLPEEKEVKVISLFRRRPALAWTLSVAASVLFLAGFFFTLKQDRNNRLKEEQTRIAYEQTKEALFLLSSNFNTGLEKVQKLQHFQKGINKATNFSAFYKYQTININPDENDHPQNKIQ